MTGCLKEPTGDCDAFGVDVVEIVTLVMVITTLMGVIIVIIILLQGPPPFRQCPKEKVFFMGGLPLNIGFCPLGICPPQDGVLTKWKSESMTYLPTYLRTDGLTGVTHLKS